jgi:hypothetical protein
MGAALRTSGEAVDHPHASTRVGACNNGGGGGDDDVVSVVLPLDSHAQQAQAFEKAEAANAKLKEKRRAEKEKKPNSGGEKELDSKRKKEKKRGSTTDGGGSAKKEQKWNKPVSAVVAAAALHEEDSEVETIDIDHSFARTTTGQSKREGGSKSSNEFGVVVPNGVGGGGPPSLVNPWSRPSALFTRNFQEESADAEMFVALARDRTKAALKAKKKQSSIIHQQQQHSAASETFTSKNTRNLSDEDEEPTQRQEFEDERLEETEF